MIRLCIAMFVALSTPLAAQWVHYPTPGIPRTPDGKPNLAAPAPRAADGKPDFSGFWEKRADKYYNNIAADLKPGDVQPWAEALYQERKKDFGKNSMEAQCLPMGPAYSTTPYRESKIIQTPTAIVILNEDLTLSPDLHGRPGIGEGSQSGLDGLFGGAMGWRHAGGGEQWIQRTHVAGC
jgi:hypothetical protein